MKDSSFFFFFFPVRSTAAVNGQWSKAAVTRADVARANVAAEGKNAREARGGVWQRWSARGSTCARGWRTRNFWLRVGARARLNPSDFGGNG
jgi:hypothetical protein